MVRLHAGNSLLGVPVYLPEDRAIPAAAVPARAGLHARVRSRPADPAARAKEGVSGWLTAAAYLTVAAIAAVAHRADRLGAAAAGGPGAAAVALAQEPGRRPRTSSHQLKHGADSPKHLVASPARRIRGNAERGNQGGFGHWGEPSWRRRASSFSASPSANPAGVRKRMPSSVSYTKLFVRRIRGGLPARARRAPAARRLPRRRAAAGPLSSRRPRRPRRRRWWTAA